MILANLHRDAQAALGHELPRNAQSQASVDARNASPLSVRKAIDQAQQHWSAGNWEATLNFLNAAGAGMSMLENRLPPEEKFARDAAEAERLPYVGSWNKAARSAYEAGRNQEALAYLDRAIAFSKNSLRQFPLEHSVLNAMYTFKGIVYLATDDVTHALEALDASLPANLAPPTNRVRPSTALAQKLAALGQREAVLAYLLNARRQTRPVPAISRSGKPN